MITNIFSLFSAYFSKTVGFGSVYSAEMNSACKNTLIRVFLQDLEKTASFLRIFEQAIAWRFSFDQKIDHTNLASFPKKHGFRKFCFYRENLMITNIFFLFSAYFSKTIGFGSVYSAEMNSACKNTLIRYFYRILAENFRTGYSMAIFMLTAKKLIYLVLAIFGKHDSFGFRKFCLKLIEKITKNRI